MLKRHSLARLGEVCAILSVCCRCVCGQNAQFCECGTVSDGGCRYPRCVTTGCIAGGINTGCTQQFVDRGSSSFICTLRTPSDTEGGFGPACASLQEVALIVVCSKPHADSQLQGLLLVFGVFGMRLPSILGSVRRCFALEPWGVVVATCAWDWLGLGTSVWLVRT